jgi:hypothetical protein
MVPYGGRLGRSVGVGGAISTTVIIPPTPNLIVEVKIKVGRKGHQIDELRGGPADVHISKPPAAGVRSAKLIGMDFLKDHHILVK